MSPLSHGELVQMEEAAKNKQRPIVVDMDTIFKEIRNDHDERIMQAVLNVGIKVNKEDLIRALELDKKVREGKLVEVVRCKDCKHRRPFYPGKGTCDLWITDGISFFDEGFCNYGERRDPNDKA